MEINKLLTVEGIYRGNTDLGYQYYQIFLADRDGNKYLASVGSRIIYQKACEKAFSRLILIPAPKAEDIPKVEEVLEEEVNEETDKGEVKNEKIHLVTD